MLKTPGCDFSFAGLKTAVLNACLSHKKDLEEVKADIALGFTDAVADTLVHKCERALKTTGLNRLVVAGGVSANTDIRNALTDLIKKQDGEIFFARREFCTDNGAMIAYAGMQRFKAGQIGSYEVKVHPRWALTDLKAL